MTNRALRQICHASVTVALAANMIGTAVIFVLIAIMNIDVISRGLFNAPFRGVVEVVIFSLILIVYLQLPDVVRSNRLTRSDGFLTYAGDRFPRFSAAAARAIDGVSAVFMAMIAWTIWPEFVDSISSCHFLTPPELGARPTGNFLTDLSAAFARCEYFGTPGIFTAPWWPANLAIFFSATLCSLLFLLKAVVGGRALAFVRLDDESG
jgi:TRAP-type C4-dicarboxylate transport system permease small subunit